MDGIRHAGTGLLRRTSSLPSPQDHEKAVTNSHNVDGSNQHAPNDSGTHLRRGLRARQVTMIALGGALGSGLLIGTGSALANAGPASIFISYTILGFIVWIVLCSLGEMAAWLPLESGFTGYATRFVDPALGFSMGYTYWFKVRHSSPK